MPDLDWAISSINRRQPTLNRWLTFYRGHHPRMFNTRRFDRSFRAVVDGARVNMCGRVVRSFTDLIVHEGWTDSNAADTPEATRLWAESRMDLHLPRLVREAAIYGDGFLSVWPDPDGVPRFSLENPRGIAIRTAPEDPTRINVAVKMWRDVERGLVRVTEYRRDVIFRWAAPSKDGTISKASSLRPLRSTDVPEGADASPETTNPYDVVPVFHIPHAVVDPPYGESVLRDVVPVQLLLNKEVGDLTIASEAATIPSRVFIGSEPDGRDTDAPKPGAVTWLPNPDARVVELAGPSIGPLRGVVDAFAADIGRVSDTPVHEIATTGDWPSGEALKTATARQMNAARKGFDALRTCTQALLEEGYASVHERAEREQLTAGMRPLLGMLGFDGPAQHRALEELLRNDQPHAIHTTCRWCGLDIEGWSDSDKYSEDWRDRGNNRRCNDGLHNHEPVDG